MRRSLLLLLPACLTLLAPAQAAVLCGVEPDSLNFGDGPLGEIRTRTLTLTNHASETCTGNLVLTWNDDCARWTLGNGSNTRYYALDPGESLAVDVTFEALQQEDGDGGDCGSSNHSATIRLGTIAEDCAVSTIPCHAYGHAPPEPGEPICSIHSGTNLIFPATVVGGASEVESFEIRNRGGGVLEGVMPHRIGDFVIPWGGPYRITDWKSWRVRFEPTTPGWHRAALEFDGLCSGYDGLYMWQGLALADGAGCDVGGGELEFGIVPVGGSALDAVVVTNIGTELLQLDLPEACGPFGIQGGPRQVNLATGNTETIVVEFTPEAPGPRECVLDLGGNVCGDIVLSGSGYLGSGIQDQVGIWFEQTGTRNSHGTTTPYEPVTAFLMILHPSVDYGVSGWECCVEVAGEIVGMSWDLAGNALNVEAPPCFAVGIGGSPLPGGEAVVLATLEFLQVDPDATTSFYVRPIASPSLPGVPLYADGIDEGHLIPLNPSSGSADEPVAFVNTATTGTRDVPRTPAELRISPNPFNPLTTIRFTLAEARTVDLEIFDASGQLVRVLLRGARHPAGSHRQEWDGHDGNGRAVPAGVYFCRLSGGSEVVIGRMVLLK